MELGTFQGSFPTVPPPRINTNSLIAASSCSAQGKYEQVSLRRLGDGRLKLTNFSAGDRVKVSNNHKQAPSPLWRRAGTIVSMGDFMGWVIGVSPSVGQQIWVRFDGSDGEELVWESWLEADSLDEE